MTLSEYDNIRQSYLAYGGKELLRLEEAVTRTVLKALFEKALLIQRDFNVSIETSPFWQSYAPLQRGHKPRGDAFPWGEVGEKVIEAYVYAYNGFANVSYPGIPYGHDVRFLTDDAFVQIDAKSTGPTDNADEVVSSPNQVTGDGLLENGYIVNTVQQVKGQISTIDFLPELAPIFLIRSKAFPVVTLYIKVVYRVIARGNQPLDYLELICVPNGLLMFDGPKYQNTKGLLIPGKDEVHVVRKRTRIRLDPLANLAEWRCVKLIYSNDTCVLKTRLGNDFTP